MSVINRMLQELDRRSAIPAAGPSAASAVRPVHGTSGHEWFWRTIAVLMIAAVAWTGWVAYQIMWPRDELVTPLAFKAAEDARVRTGQMKAAQKPKPAAPVVPPVVAAPPSAPEATPPAATAPVASAATQPVEAPPAAKEPAAPAPPPKAPAPVAKAPEPVKAPAQPRLPASTLHALDLPPAKVLALQPRKVERRDRQSGPEELAEREFRRAVDLLKRGRGPEAEAGFAAALAQDPGHRAARQALVALALERGNLEAGRRLLEEGLARDAAQPEFAMTLARIYAERQDYPHAIAVLDASLGAAGASSDYHLLHGAVLQRAGDHARAAGAYRAVLDTQAANAQAWIGLGISLEALKRRPEAAEAFRRALVAGPVNADLKVFAEQRLRALR
jgi:MSHA biogenesis protein MshN